MKQQRKSKVLLNRVKNKEKEKKEHLNLTPQNKFLPGSEPILIKLDQL